MTTVPCNRCGVNCMRHFGDAPETASFYGLAAQFTGGYLSTAFEDLTLIRFALCEECVAELVKTFQLPPQITDLDLNILPIPPWRPGCSQ